MPLVLYKGSLELRCVNDHGEGPSTMTTVESWMALQHVESSSQGGLRLTGTASPVRFFSCKTCGYVELYSGEVIDPKTWSR